MSILDFNIHELFAEPVEDFAHSRNVPLVGFVVCDDQITHLSDASRGMRAGTALRRLNLKSHFKLTKSIPIADVEKAVPSAAKANVMKKLHRGGLFPQGAFQALINVITLLAPETAPILERFMASRMRRIERLGGVARKALAQQKEAVVTSLAIAGIDRKELGVWDYDEAIGPSSFLDGITSVRLREDQMVINDLSFLPGYSEIVRTQHNSVTFESNVSKVTVVLANRLPLEKQTGADLIYYNETFKCFLMVQYKAMEPSNDYHVFRFPQPQLEEEIERMDSILRELSKCAPNDTADGFRLCENPFFLKLCPRILFEPDNLRLSTGMYLPLDYWKLISQHPDTIGKMGGRLLSYRNVRRYFDNTDFVTVAKGGWIGTTIHQSAELAKLIRQVLESSRALVFTVKEERDLRHRDPDYAQKIDLGQDDNLDDAADIGYPE